MALTPDDLKALQDLYGDLLKTQQEILEGRNNELDVTRSINDAIRDQLGLVKKNVDFKTSTRRLLDQINKIAENNVDFTEEERDILLDQESLLKRQNNLFKSKQQLLREQGFVSNRIKTLENDILATQGEERDILESQLETFENINHGLSEAIINSEVFAENLEQALNASREVDKLGAPKFFDGIADIASAIPGLRKISGPFKDAAKAAKEMASSQVAANLATKQRVAHYHELLDSGTEIQDALEQAGVTSEEVSNGFTFNPAKIGINSLKAGFKSLGPVIAEALGPIALITLAAKAVKFFVDEMFAASDQTTMFSNNMLLSKESARELRKETFTTTNLYNELAIKQGELTITQGSYLKTLNLINDQLGLQLDLTRDFGKETSKNVIEASILADQYGLSAEAATQLFLDAERLNKPLKEYTKEIFGQLAYQSTQKGLMVDITKTIEEASQISGELRANFKGSTLELAQAVYQSKLLGLSLNQTQRIAEGLLNFQSSIESEMQAELLTGRQLNLEKAREAALNNDNLGVLREITAQGITQEEFLKSNYIQRKAIAGALNLSVDELADMFQKQKELGALEEKSLRLKNRLKLEGISLDDKSFDAQKASLFEIAEAAQKAGKSEAEIRDILADQVEDRKREQSATQKFNKALEQLKEKFTELVDGGLLDSLIDSLTGIAESSFFKGYAEQGKAKREFDKLKTAKEEGNKNITDKDLRVAEEGTKNLGFGMKSIITTLAPGLGYLTTKIIEREIESKRQKTRETIKRVGLSEEEEDIKNPDLVDDFILRPGKKPLKFNKNDLLIGGTNLLNETTNNKSIDNNKSIFNNIDNTRSISSNIDNTKIQNNNIDNTKLDGINNKLETLIQIIQQGGNVYMDSIKVGETISKTLSQIS